MAEDLRLVGPPPARGARLDRFLAEPLGSRAAAQRAIEEGRVRVEGRERPKRHVLSGGETIEVSLPPRDGEISQGGVAPFTVAYEDEHLLVVDKPAGVVVHPARGHWSGTLAQALAGRARPSSPHGGSAASMRPWSTAARRRGPARSTRRSDGTGATASSSRWTPTSRARRAPTSRWSARSRARRCWG